MRDEKITNTLENIMWDDYDFPIDRYRDNTLNIDCENLSLIMPLVPVDDELLHYDPKRDLYASYIRTYRKNAIFVDHIPMNASKIVMSSHHCIVSQGPHRLTQLDTVKPFFKMVEQEKCDAIIMVTDPLDPKTGSYKCFDYTVMHDKPIQEKFCVKSMDISTFNSDLFLYELDHVYYQNWVDRESPKDKRVFKAFLTHCLRYKKPLIHCGAGIGRAGVAVALISLYKHILEEKPLTLNIPKWILQLRCQRGALVRRPNQVKFCIEMISELLNNKE